MCIVVRECDKKQNAAQASCLQIQRDTDFSRKSDAKKKTAMDYSHGLQPWITPMDPKQLGMSAYNWQVHWHRLCMFGHRLL